MVVWFGVENLQIYCWVQFWFLSLSSLAYQVTFVLPISKFHYIKLYITLNQRHVKMQICKLIKQNWKIISLYDILCAYTFFVFRETLNALYADNYNCA